MNDDAYQRIVREVTTGGTSDRDTIAHLEALVAEQEAELVTLRELTRAQGQTITDAHAIFATLRKPC
jgi:hypothetical protein